MPGWELLCPGTAGCASTSPGAVSSLGARVTPGNQAYPTGPGEAALSFCRREANTQMVTQPTGWSPDRTWVFWVQAIAGAGLVQL